MNRTQHIISSGLVAFVGLWVCGISYTQQPAEAFLFPFPWLKQDKSAYVILTSLIVRKPVVA